MASPRYRPRKISEDTRDRFIFTLANRGNAVPASPKATNWSTWQRKIAKLTFGDDYEGRRRTLQALHGTIQINALQENRIRKALDKAISASWDDMRARSNERRQEIIRDGPNKSAGEWIPTKARFDKTIDRFLRENYVYNIELYRHVGGPVLREALRAEMMKTWQMTGLGFRTPLILTGEAGGRGVDWPAY